MKLRPTSLVLIFALLAGGAPARGDDTSPALQDFAKLEPPRAGACASGNSGPCGETYNKAAADFISLQNKISNASQAMGVDGCMGQNAAQTCNKDNFTSGANSYTSIANDLKAAADDLVTRSGKALQGAKEVARPMTGVQRANAKKYATSIDGISGSSLVDAYGTEAKRGEARKACLSSVGPGSSTNTFCDLLGAGETAKAFSYVFSEVNGDYTAKAAQFAAKANESATNEKNGATNTSSGLSSPMGLDDMLKVATVGMMGAGLYCSMTGKCAPKPSTVDSSTATNGATSPTPSSLSGTNGVPSSSLGGAGINAPAANLGTPSPPQASATAEPSAPVVDAQAASNLPLATVAAGFANSRNPASGAPAGSASSTGANGAGEAPSSSTATATASDASKSTELGINLGGGGAGGMPGGGAFSLSDAKTSPTDAALKNILNGDSPPPGGDALGALLDQGAGSPSASAGEAGPGNPESLFFRVRDGYHRCLKRGCVTPETGGKI